MMESEQKHQAVIRGTLDWEHTFDAIPDLIAIIDKNMRIVRANKAMTSRLGLTQTECKGKLCHICIHGMDEPPDFCPHVQLLKDGQEHSAEVYVERLGGIFTITVSPIFDAKGNTTGCVHVARDITERKRIEETLAQSEQKFRSLVETTSDWIWEVDRNRVYTYVSPRIKNLLGYEQREVIGKTPFDFMPQAEAHRVGLLFRDIVESQKPFYQLENTNLHKDGRRVVLETSGVPIFDATGYLQGYRGIDRDISDSKLIEEALRIKDRVIELSVNPIAMADLQRNLMYANNSFLRTWGYDSDSEVLGKPTSLFWSMSAKAGRALHRQGDWIGKVSGTGNDGSSLDLQLSATLVRDTQGKQLCLAFSFVDITEVSQLRRRLKTEQSFAGIVGHDAKMLELFDTIREVAEVAVPVLIQGESGTGKELVAAAIHTEGPRAEKPFVPVNCGALPEGILESELFGHVKGAFTGAVRDRKGRFELADGGTIFLDEVGDIPPVMQVKLLRVLQEGAFEHIGGEQTIKVDVRVISATNKDLRQEVAAGRFREDLFYRLSVVPVVLPPLRERCNDIPLLVDYILKKVLAETDRKDVTFSHDAIEALVDYAWPGNVRELENAIQYALVKCRGKVLEPKHLPPMLGRARAFGPEKRRRRRKLNAKDVQEALKHTGGNKVRAAQRLGVSRATLYRFLEDAGISSQSKQ